MMNLRLAIKVKLKMARKSPNAETYKLLYAKSGNECAFPDCNHPIFDDESDYVAQLCHIKSAEQGGQRYDFKQTDDERRSYENLMFMCHMHHKKTDNVEKYTVEKLLEMKENHERKYTQKGKEATEQMIRQIQIENASFWNNQANRKFEFEDFKISREFDKDIKKLLSELDEHIQTLEDYCEMCANSDENDILESDLKTLMKLANLDYSNIETINYQSNPFKNRNWEMHNIGRQNFFAHIKLYIVQLKVKIFEELVTHHPNDLDLKQDLTKSQSDFDTINTSSYYVD